MSCISLSLSLSLSLSIFKLFLFSGKIRAHEKHQRQLCGVAFLRCPSNAITKQKRCSPLCFLSSDDETHLSTWVAHELQMAQHQNIPIVTVIDVERYRERDIIEQYQVCVYLHSMHLLLLRLYWFVRAYQQLGFGAIFSKQIIQVRASMETRPLLTRLKHCFMLSSPVHNHL